MEPYLVSNLPRLGVKFLPSSKYVVENTAEKNAEKFATCWNTVHVAKAALYIGMFEICLFVLSIFGFVYATKHHVSIINETNLIINFAFGGGLFFMVCVMFIGLKKQNGNFLIPHLCWQIIGVMGMTVGLVLMIAYQPAYDSVLFYFMILFICAKIGLQIYFITIIYSCCMYFYEKPYLPTDSQFAFKDSRDDVSDYDFWNYHPDQYF